MQPLNASSSMELCVCVCKVFQEGEEKMLDFSSPPKGKYWGLLLGLVDPGAQLIEIANLRVKAN